VRADSVPRLGLPTLQIGCSGGCVRLSMVEK
jgi:hypothetical protein